MSYDVTAVNFDPDSLIVYLLLATNAVLCLWLIALEWRLHKVFRGRAVRDLESILAELGRTVDDLVVKSAHDDKLFEDIYRRLKSVLQKYHTVRFNPFPDHGGNQSFATSLLDEEGNGVVISSLYSRDKVSVYAKPLMKFHSEYELSKEETEAIETARRQKQT